MPIQVDEVVVARDELYLVHASGPRGDAARRRHTVPKHVAMKVGPYEVQGFLHGLPGADPVVSIRRRKPMIPLTGARIAYVVNGEPREDELDTVILNRERIEWIRRSSRTARRSRSGGRRSTSTDPRAPEPPSRPGATIGRRCPTDPTSPPARSPDSASSTARRSWPGRTARCCSVTSVPRSSRSSHRRAMRPAAGVRRGSARAAGTRTAAYFLAVNRNKRGLRLDLKSPDGAAVLRRLLADADVLVENFRGDGFARLGFDDEALRTLNPRLVHLAISGYGPAARRPTGPATTSSSRPSAG